MKIVYKNMEVEVEDNTTVKDAFIEKIEKENSNIIACKIDNELKPLDYVLKENDVVELVKTSTRDGARTYTRGALFIMAKAFKELYPEKKLTINYQLTSSMFCELYNEVPTEEVITNVKKKMQEIIDKNLPITERVMTKEEAIMFLDKENTFVRKNAIRK